MSMAERDARILAPTRPTNAPAAPSGAWPMTAVLSLAAAAFVPAAGAGESPAPVEYLREGIQETFTGPDEAVTDLRLANSRWPDCYSSASAIADIFRLEGVADRSDHDKAMALWKWLRILFSPKYGGYYFEADEKGEWQIVYDGHKILTAYGHHYCDGVAWVMSDLWRGAGYVAIDHCHHSHTIPSLRYRDHDGHWRFHNFEPEFDFYYWDEAKGIVSTGSMPLMRSHVHRHLVFPQRVHTLWRSLRAGETVEWKWDNEGYAIPYGKQGPKLKLPPAYEYRPGRTDGVYAAVGQETQVVAVEAEPERYASALFTGSAHTACSPVSEGKATLHPDRSRAPAFFVYRVPSPFTAVDADVEAALVKSHEADVCRLSLSVDGGKSWKPVFVKEKTGAEQVKVSIGLPAREEGRPNVYSCYDFLVRAEFQTAGDPRGVGMDRLRVTVRRQCNKRTLPNLMPGKNVLRLSGQLKPGQQLDLLMRYRVNGEERSRSCRIASLPFYFEIDTGPVEEPPLKNYDQAFNVGALQMDRIVLAAVRAGDAPADASLPAGAAEAEFRKPSPHPADMARPKAVKTPETDPMQTSGFFPQSREVRRDREAMEALIKVLRDPNGKRWDAAQDLGNYPEAIDALLEVWPEADIDLKLHLCNALAQIRDPKAIEPLLKSWEDVPRGAPGTRYIPDVLAAIGDRRVVPQLIAPLGRVRFDYRLHIIRALGLLGGPEAEAALKDLAARDPYPALRQFAVEMLEHLAEQQ